MIESCEQGGQMTYLGLRRFQDGSKAPVWQDEKDLYWADLGHPSYDPGLRPVEKTPYGFRRRIIGNL